MTDSREFQNRPFDRLSGPVLDAPFPEAAGVRRAPDRNEWWVYLDPGPPPRLADSDGQYQQTFTKVIEYSSFLDPDDGVMIDISPASIGNNTPGTNDGNGYETNPVTEVEYEPQYVPRGRLPPGSGGIPGRRPGIGNAAEALTRITGSEYFPGGLGEFPIEQNEFLEFEQSPSVDMVLQWASYADAADECSLSRI